MQNCHTHLRRVALLALALIHLGVAGCGSGAPSTDQFESTDEADAVDVVEQKTTNLREYQQRKQARAREYQRPLLEQLAQVARAQVRYYEANGHYFVPIQRQNDIRHVERALLGMELVDGVGGLQIFPSRGGYIAAVSHQMLPSDHNCRIRVDGPPEPDGATGARATCSWQTDGKVWRLK